MIFFYRQLVSIECPRSYEPRALPLRHAGETNFLEWKCCVYIVQLDNYHL